MSKESCPQRRQEKPAAISAARRYSCLPGWRSQSRMANGGGQSLSRRSSDMLLRRSTANLLSVAVVVFLCSLLTTSLIAQEKADLAKLSAQLKDKDAAIRRSAVESLGQLSDQSGVDLLISALNDDNQEVRSAAALALGQTGAAKGVEPLTKLLQSQRIRDRRSAILALGTIGGVKACD